MGVEITHRAVGVNLTQMILSINLLDRNTHGCSWLPLYHDMGLSMIGFPTVYGGHSTLMSPTAFIRRPQRWIKALSDGCTEGRVITAAPNFAYEYTAQRGVPKDGAGIDLGKAVMIIGSEPVSIDAIRNFEKAFAPSVYRRQRSSRPTVSPRRHCSSPTSPRTPSLPWHISIAPSSPEAARCRQIRIRPMSAFMFPAGSWHAVCTG